jgi:RimJ/RimL family protein N-acetyltransferase
MSWSDTTITSQRLALRPFTAADADEAFACITPTLTRYLSFEPPSNPAQFEAVWRGWLQEIAAGTDFNFTLRERASGRFMGLLGLHRARR